MKKRWIILAACIALFVGIKTAFAAVPQEYYPNFEIQEDYNKIINELFVDIQAKIKAGQQIPTSTFADLNTKFNTIFPYFPNKYSFNVVYQTCKDVSQSLANTYNFNMLANFMDNCFTPLTNIVKEINTTYAIKASATIGPSSGPAPLTVTFDARASIDPSNQTIPSNNFFWYYRDVNGVDKPIGVGPILNYTFDEPGNYIVHLTVRSSNKTTQGIFDGSEMFTIDVAPRSANIVIYANGQKLEKNKKRKVGLQEAQRGVVLDGSATTPRGGREIVAHRREITGPDNLSIIRVGTNIPENIKAILPVQGEYTVSVSTTDNQNNTLTEKFNIAVSDPVAIIKQMPEKGNTSAIYSFDAKPSYSVISRLRLFTWEIFDTDGNKIDTIQWTAIKKQFNKPGTYVVRLTVEDDLAQKNSESLQVIVESTDPIPQFTMKPRLDRSAPSEFVLDATATYDVDVINKNDELRYEWSFSSPNTTKIIEAEPDNKRVVVTFDDIGKQTVKLTVTDKYGKIASIEKTVDIKSTLRPKIYVAPRATVRGNDIKFVVQSDKSIINYAWDFSDGATRTIQTNNIDHRFDRVGAYKVKLKVAGGTSEENEISTMVFVGERQSPVPAYLIQDNVSNSILSQIDVCTDQGQEYPAYRVDRYQKLTINAKDSVNIKGEKKGLKFYYQPQNEDTLSDISGVLPYDFKDVGCRYIDLLVEDTEVAKNSKIRIWFKVVNALPVLDNILLNFPQFGNEVGIGLQETKSTEKDIFNSEYDPLMVKVTASNPKDPDGFISYYQFYYYPKEDPNRILGTKISPANVPYAFFSLPKIPGEYAFGVKIFDTDGGSQRSEEVIGLGPVVFFPPDASKPDIPLVTLKVDKSNVEVGEEITFEVSSRILSDRADFVQERVIQYDFDGDGNPDITTKKDKLTYVYTKVNENGFTPIASVLYRWYKGSSNGERIIVKNGLKPILLFTTFDTFALFRDVSIGDIAEQEICLDIQKCDTDENYSLKWPNEAFVLDYKEHGKYAVSMDLIDKSANTASKRWIVETTPTNTQKPVHILSIPETTVTSGVDGQTFQEIFVGKNLDNTVLLYVKSMQPWATCYVDSDINVDSNNDGKTDGDKDFDCNTIKSVPYNPQYESVIGRVYYEVEGKITAEDFTVSFIDYAVDLQEDQKELYDLINQALETIDADHEANKYVREQLINARNNIVDSNDIKAIVISLENYIQTNEVLLSVTEKEIIDQIIEKTTDKSVSAALGDNIYEQAKAEILWFTPKNIESTVINLFTQFEQAQGTQTQNLQDIQKQILQQILTTIAQTVAPSSDQIEDNQIDPVDMETIILPNICSIAQFYNIATENCSSETLQPIPDNTTTVWSTWSGFSGILKTIFIIVGIAIGIFVLLVIIFAIKAKLSNNDEEEEEEIIITDEQTTTPPPAQTNTTTPEQTPPITQ